MGNIYYYSWRCKIFIFYHTSGPDEEDTDEIIGRFHGLAKV